MRQHFLVKILTVVIAVVVVVVVIRGRRSARGRKQTTRGIFPPTAGAKVTMLYSLVSPSLDRAELENRTAVLRYYL